MFKINLDNNKSFKWYKDRRVYSKGYLFDNKDTLYKEQSLNYFFNFVSNIEDFRNRVASANGSFAVIIKNKNKLYAGVDRLRSIPLFYALKDNIFYVSDNAFWIKSELNMQEGFDKKAEQEFLLTGYVSGKDTLFDTIKQIQAGEYIVAQQLDGKIDLKRTIYYKYIHRDYFQKSRNELFKNLDQVSNNFINRLIKSLNKKTIVLPLSGGFDSRYIATMLKKTIIKTLFVSLMGKKVTGNQKFLS